MIFSKLAMLIVLLVLPFLAVAEVPLKIEAGAGKINFLAVGRPSMLKIHGEASSPAAILKVDGNQLKGTVEIELERFNTGIALRDQHLKEKYLQVKEYPKSKLALLEAPVDPGFEKSLNNEGEKNFRGNLALHGKEHDVKGTFSAKAGQILAKFPITLSDYAIDIPKYLGVTVADSVEITVELPLKKE